MCISFLLGLWKETKTKHDLAEILLFANSKEFKEEPFKLYISSKGGVPSMLIFSDNGEGGVTGILM